MLAVYDHHSNYCHNFDVDEGDDDDDIDDDDEGDGDADDDDRVKDMEAVHLRQQLGEIHSSHRVTCLEQSYQSIFFLKGGCCNFFLFFYWSPWA